MIRVSFGSLQWPKPAAVFTSFVLFLLHSCSFLALVFVLPLLLHTSKNPGLQLTCPLAISALPDSDSKARFELRQAQLIVSRACLQR